MKYSARARHCSTHGHKNFEEGRIRWRHQLRCAASVLPPTSVLFFRAKHNNEKVSILASGSLESIKPNIIIPKRIAFIGYPFKIHRKTCTVRFMFFNPADVNWFRPVELVTSRQFRRGHIKESLGTHGYMKCIFDKQIQQNEQIAMNLYKRIFPKWMTRICTVLSLSIENDRPEENNMEL
jgi:pre-rRNA-processing protein TSR1